MSKLLHSKRPQHQEAPGLSSELLHHYLAGPSGAPDAAASRLTAHKVAIKALLLRLEKLVVPELLPAVSALLADLDDFRVQVSLVGQVKAGKTMLTNALVGMPGMLPSDVNPWTSVVTSVHINTPKPQNANAVFTFYTEAEWANLTESGGRLGELAQRADFETELADMRVQIAEMQRRTEDRLGANFGLLLGGQHNFLGFSREIIERYVCLGEKDAPAIGGGRYADVTRAADLYVDDTSYAVPMTVNDTPGVNDPFLARERVTLDTLSRTDICVVVLTAHQSFSTVDLALLRILLALRPEQIVLFVNRVDELEDPDRQIVEIEGFIRSILREKGIREALPIVFGSAAWAEHMLLGPIGAPGEASTETLARLGAARARRAGDLPAGKRLLMGRPPYSTAKMNDLSGLHELKALVSHKSIRDVAAPFTTEILLRAADLAQQSTLVMEQVLGDDLPLRPGLDIGALVDHLDTLLRDLDQDCHDVASALSDQMLLTMSTAYREFVDTESANIRDIVKSGRRLTDWSPDSEALRRALNASYHTFASACAEKATVLYAKAASQIGAVYAEVLQQQGQLFSVRAPRVMQPKTPASLMRTMTIDMKTTWVGNWLARATGASSYVSRFRDTVTDEMREFLATMRDVHVLDFVNQLRRGLHDFLLEHMNTLQNLAVLDGSKQGSLIRQKLGVEIELTQRVIALKGLNSELQALIDAVCADFELAVE